MLMSVVITSLLLVVLVTAMIGTLIYSSLINGTQSQGVSAVTKGIDVVVVTLLFGILSVLLKIVFIKQNEDHPKA